MSSKAMFKFDEAAKAYLDASNDLMEEIETRGFAAASRKQVWDALNDEWDARQAVLDAGEIGNYAEVVRTYRGIGIACAVGFAAGSIAFSMVMARRAVIEARKANRRARRAERLREQAWSETYEQHNRAEELRRQVETLTWDLEAAKLDKVVAQ